MNLLPCDCYFCHKSETHPSDHREYVRINGVMACTKCAHSQEIPPVPMVKKRLSIPAPACVMGYPQAQLCTFMSHAQEKDFLQWMVGQTVGVCDGRRYDHDTKTFSETGCGPHGTVVYAHDLMDWFAGKPVTD